MLAAYSMLLCLGVQSGPDELHRLQGALASYYGDIRSLHLKTTGDWIPNPKEPEPAFLKNAWKQSVKRGKRQLPALELWHAYPRMRADTTPLPDEPLKNKLTCIIADGRYKQFDHRFGQLHDLPVEDLGGLDHTPLVPLGLRMRGTQNTSLAEVLSLTSLATLSTEGGVKTVRVGPSIPRTLFSGQFKEQGTVSFRFDETSLPLPREVTLTIPLENAKGHLRDHYKLSDFRDVVNQAGSRPTKFPFKLEFESEVGTTVWRITEVEINPSITKTVFEADALPVKSRR